MRCPYMTDNDSHDCMKIEDDYAALKEQLHAAETALAEAHRLSYYEDYCAIKLELAETKAEIERLNNVGIKGLADALAESEQENKALRAVAEAAKRCLEPDDYPDDLRTALAAWHKLRDGGGE